MELFYLLPITILVVIILSITISTLVSQKQLPPGPMKLPIIGNIHNMIGALPHHALRRLSQKYGPLMHLKLGESSTLIVSSAEMAKEFMKTNDLLFASRPVGPTIDACFGSVPGNITFSPYGDYWKQIRKITIVELLNAKRVQSFSSIREEEVQNLVRSIQSSPNLPVNLSERLVGLTSMIIYRAAFGRIYDREEAVVMGSTFRELIVLSGRYNICNLYPSVKLLQVLDPGFAKIIKKFKDINGILQNIIDKHVSEPKINVGQTADIEDLVDVFLGLQKKSDDLEDPLTIKSIIAIMVDIFGAGFDTSSTTVEWAMAEMMKQPNIMAKAQAEIRQTLKGKNIIKEVDIQGLCYLKLVIKETLRLHPPAPLYRRECRETCVIKGYTIPKKIKVLINSWAIGRDPKYWEDAESFNPERFVNSSLDFKGLNLEFIPFGAGRRMCPGMNFGLANVEMALTQLLYYFDWKFPDLMKAKDLDMTENFGATLSKKFDLRLISVPFILVEK